MTELTDEKRTDWNNMGKIASIILAALICACPPASAERWTEENARQEAFRNIQLQADVSRYAAVDPDFEENQKALKLNIETVGNRFITKNDDPIISYIVSYMDDKTMFYGSDGHLLAVRTVSGFDYPRIKYIYCVADTCDNDGKEAKSGELMSVSVDVSDNEVFYFLPDGRCTGHLTYD